MVALVPAGPLSAQQRDGTRDGARPAKWEYKMIRAVADTARMEATLNQLGEEGWELVGEVTDRRQPSLILKRPRAEKGVGGAKGSVKEELKALAGTWDVLSMTIAGQFLEGEALANRSFVVNGATASLVAGDDSSVAAVKLDPAGPGRTIDLVLLTGPGKGRTLSGIYKIEEDVLTLCIVETGDRPAEFTSKADSGRSLSVWRRRK
jgi:uncharacterized protein (TIGR03067 family)